MALEDTSDATARERATRADSALPSDAEVSS
jgi:hypothetical protein